LSRIDRKNSSGREKWSIGLETRWINFIASGMSDGPPLCGISERIWWRAFWALAMAGVLWRLIRFAVGMPVWGDEAMLGLNIVNRDFSGLLLPLELHQVAPVVYVWLQKAVQIILGANEYSMRLVALVEGLAALAVLGVVLRRMLFLPEAVFAFGVIAVGTYSVRHSVELKPYAQDLLSSCLVWWGLVHYLSRPVPQRCLLLAGVLAAAVILSFPGVFVAGGAIIAVAVLHKNCLRIAIPRLAVLSGFTMATFAVVYFHSLRGQIVRHETGMTTYWAEAFPPGNLAAFPLWFLKVHTGNLMAYPFGGKNFASSLTALAALAGMVALVKRRSWVLLTAVVAPFALTLMAAALHRYPYGGSARVSQHLAPAIALLTGVGICAALRSIPTGIHQRRAAVILISVFLMLAVGGATRDIVRPYKIRGVYEARQAINTWISSLEPSERIECLTPPESWDVCMQWLFLPVSSRFHGAGWPGNLTKPSDRAWVISATAHGDFLEAVQSRWPQAKILDHRVDDFALMPPNPHRQHFERALLQIAEQKGGTN